ncbi:hypothetical protein NXV22_04950 [Bacteroides thetaiotaomicron]|nr:hypothetical protein [Bacteroides thetaiotaomicron]
MWNGLLGMEFDAFYNYTYDILTAMGRRLSTINGRILLYVCQL